MLRSGRIGEPSGVDRDLEEVTAYQRDGHPGYALRAYPRFGVHIQ
jgi:hypothetical protein